MFFQFRNRIPTDLDILNDIYDRYYQTFSDYELNPSSRSSKIYVPIDIAEVSSNLKVDEDLIFGRLYYHLEDKYGYNQTDGARVHFFAMAIGGDRHCIHFPYLASVLSMLQQEDRKFRTATSIATASLFVSAMAIVFSILL